MTAEQHISRLSFFGRLADDFTRRPIPGGEIHVSVDEDPQAPQYKDDGHFAFVDLEPSATDYHFQLGAPGYSRRAVAKALPTLTPVQIAYDGEDELYLNLVAPPAAGDVIKFEAIPFIPPVPKDAQVFGEAGFVAALAEPLEGRNVSTATLTASGGLGAGQILRVRRGPNLRLRRAPTATHPADVTVVALRIAENDPAEPPLEGAVVTVTQVNGAPPTAVAVGSLTLQRFSLAGTSLLILDDGSRVTNSDERGDAVLVFPGEKVITSVTVSVVRAQYVTVTPTIAITVKTRNFQKVLLTHV